MTKKDLSRAVSERTGILQTQAHEYVQRVLGTMLETLAAEGRVELRTSVPATRLSTGRWS